MKKVWRKASLSFVFLLLCGLLNFTSSYFKVFLFVFTGIASSVVGVVTAQIIDMQTIQILVSSCIIGPILKVGLGMPSFCNEKYLTASIPLLLRGFVSDVMGSEKLAQGRGDSLSDHEVTMHKGYHSTLTAEIQDISEAYCFRNNNLH